MAMKRTRCWLGDKEQLNPKQRKERPKYKYIYIHVFFFLMTFLKNIFFKFLSFL